MLPRSGRYRKCDCRALELLQATQRLESFSRKRALAVLSNAAAPLVDDVLLLKQPLRDFLLKDYKPKASAFLGHGLGDHTAVSNFPEAGEVTAELFTSGPGVQPAYKNFAAEVRTR